MDNPPTLKEFILRAAKQDLSNWHLYSEGMNIIVDDVFRYEDLEAEFPKIAHSLLKDEGEARALVDRMVKVNTGYRPAQTSHKTLLDHETRKIIAMNCLPEINHFGYEP